MKLGFLSAGTGCQDTCEVGIVQKKLLSACSRLVSGDIGLCFCLEGSFLLREAAHENDVGQAEPALSITSFCRSSCPAPTRVPRRCQLGIAASAPSMRSSLKSDRTSRRSTHDKPPSSQCKLALSYLYGKYKESLSIEQAAPVHTDSGSLVAMPLASVLPGNIDL